MDGLLARQGYAGVGGLCYPSSVGVCDPGAWAGDVCRELRGFPGRDGPV